MEARFISNLNLDNINNIDTDNLTMHENDLLNTIRLFSRVDFDESFLLNLFINENIEYRDVTTPLNPIDLGKQKRVYFKDIIGINDISNIKEIICAICLENFDNEDLIINLNCSHIFHNSCLEKWLSEYNNKCPKCRMEIGESKPNI